MEMFFLLEQSLVICNALISYKVVFRAHVAQHSNHYLITVVKGGGSIGQAKFAQFLNA